MAVKRFNIDGLGVVSVYKRKGTKSLKLSISHRGEIRVVIPNWIPYKTAVNFAKSKNDWIGSQRSEVPELEFYNGQDIGRGHRLLICNDNSAKIRTQIKGTEARIYTNSNNRRSDEFHKAAYKLCLRVLKIQSKEIVLGHLKDLAEDNNFEYRALTARSLKARWGSCNQFKDITINIFLVQLPWELIEYVLLHELVHTKVMHHQADFWEELSKYVSDPKSKRKEIKRYKPELLLKARTPFEYV
ncbi:MAG TPA: YgjP-like metallopeptidase domain-containing protein [Candidatus Saccharimonadales bacterium]|nr:YgjP-like metallopeptidase domain-containing protein [Candidatus Saccharimonadales bacterium]